LWQCCGKTVEGDGDQGPPDGWCYEGKHTTDIKRARWRADSTPQDDKLVSCLRKNCNNIRSRLASSPPAKPPSSSSAPRRPPVQRKRTRSIKQGDVEDREPPAADEQPMEVDQDEASVTGSVRGRSKRKAEAKTELRTRSTEPGKPRSPSKASTTTARRATSVNPKPKSRAGRKSLTKNEEDSAIATDDATRKKRRKMT